LGFNFFLVGGGGVCATGHSITFWLICVAESLAVCCGSLNA